MAAVIPGDIINSIHGRMGNLVFYNRRGTQCVSIHVISRNPDTESQRRVRRTFRDAVRSWQAMNPDEQYAFNRKARFINMSGYNLFISQYMKIEIQAVRNPETGCSNPANVRFSHYPYLFPSVSIPNTKQQDVNIYKYIRRVSPG